MCFTGKDMRDHLRFPLTNSMSDGPDNLYNDFLFEHGIYTVKVKQICSK